MVLLSSVFIYNTYNAIDEINYTSSIYLGAPQGQSTISTQWNTNTQNNYLYTKCAYK